MLGWRNKRGGSLNNITGPTCLSFFNSCTSFMTSAMSACVLRTIVLQAAWRCAARSIARRTDEYAPLPAMQMNIPQKLSNEMAPSKFAMSNNVWADHLHSFGLAMRFASGEIPNTNLLSYLRWPCLCCCLIGKVLTYEHWWNRALGTRVWKRPGLTLSVWKHELVSIHKQNRSPSEQVTIDLNSVGRGVPTDYGDITAICYNAGH